MLTLQPRDKYRYIFYNIKIRNIFWGHRTAIADWKLICH